MWRVGGGRVIVQLLRGPFSVVTRAQAPKNIAYSAVSLSLEAITDTVGDTKAERRRVLTGTLWRQNRLHYDELERWYVRLLPPQTIREKNAGLRFREAGLLMRVSL